MPPRLRVLGSDLRKDQRQAVVEAGAVQAEPPSATGARHDGGETHGWGAYTHDNAEGASMGRENPLTSTHIFEIFY